MRLKTTLIVLAAMLLSVSAYYFGRSTAPSAFRLTAGAGHVEIVPPASMQQSPAAIELIDRLMQKHVMLLQQPALVKQVLQNPDTVKGEFRKAHDLTNRFVQAIRARAIPDTNVIEVSIDPGFAGKDAPALAEALVNQHLQNEALIGQNALLERSVVLNNLKQRYQFRKDELGRDLREKAVRLSIDGMGTPGRLSAKEVELQDALKQQFERLRALEDAKAALGAAEAENEEGPATVKAQKMVDATQLHMRAIQERVDILKADLGDLTNAMQQYLVLKDDEKATRELLRQVNGELEQISQRVNQSPPEIRWLCHPDRG